MGEKWARKFEKCQQCGTKRFKHVGKGLCKRCYRLVRKLEDVNRWDFSDPESAIGYLTGTDFLDPDKFRRIKRRVVEEIQEQLRILRGRERLLEGPINGSNVEAQLSLIASQCHVKNKNLFHGISLTIDRSFEMEQRERCIGC
jgi:hypothetical protein